MGHRKITVVAGARPNFMKIAPIIRAFDRVPEVFSYRLTHTGQHYDEAMNAVFFRELGIPAPDVFLGAGGGTHAEQTARIMVAFEAECIAHRPDLVLVVGDVNSTFACAVTAKKLNIAVAHVEAGLRSGDRSMPEEINRILTDAISDFFFVSEPEGVSNLLREGQSADHVFHVGQVMVDNLLYECRRLDERQAPDFPSTALKRQLGHYGVVTLHRPSNVDEQGKLLEIVSALNEISGELPLVFPVHPRTRSSIERLDCKLAPAIHLLPPLPFAEFLSLWRDAAVVLTDSGGLQEETTALGVPCITMRDNTERPITVTEGSNLLAGTSSDNIIATARRVLRGERVSGRRPELWDGHAADRIVAALARLAFP